MEFNELKNDAANAPHVDGLIILLFEKDHLWGPVPPRSDVAGDGSLLALSLLDVFVDLGLDLHLDLVVLGLVLHN